VSQFNPTRRDFIKAAGLSIGAAALTQQQAAAQANQPNIIFILADDLGYGDLGCYGQERIQTPNIDRMAAQGMRFTQCYAGSTVCAPSRSVLMQGLHTGHCHIRGNKRVPLEPQHLTAAEYLKNAGYTTGLIGKWGLGNEGTTGTPNKQGFDYFFGYLDQGHAHNYYPGYLWRNDEKVDMPGNDTIDEYTAGTKGTWTPNAFTQESLDFIEQNQDGPFFLYHATIIPHAANESGRHYGNETGEGMPVPSNEKYADEDWPLPQKNHAAMITELDDHVGAILDKLEELGIADNTLVIFSSDNGPHKEGGVIPEYFDSNGAMRGIKRDLYEGGIRVPGIAWWPGTVPADTTSDHIWAFWDLFPTWAELAGLEAPSNLDGISIAPTLRGNPDAQEEHEYLYWEFHEGGFKQAVRAGDWKAVRLNPDKAVELYNLAEDVSEENNVAEKYPDVTARLTGYIENARTPSEHWPGGRR